MGGSKDYKKVAYRRLIRDANGNLTYGSDGKPAYERAYKYVRVTAYKARNKVQQNSDVARAASRLRNSRRGEQTPKEKTFRDKVNEATSKKALLGVMREKFGTANVKAAFVNNNDLGMVKRVLNTVEDLQDRYPVLKDMVTSYDITKAQNVPALMGGSFNISQGLVRQTLKLGNGFWNTSDNPALLSGAERGFHPPNQTPESTIAHEFSHGIQNFIMGKMLTNMSSFSAKIDFIDKLRNGTALDFLEQRAMQTLGISNASTARGQISGYSRDAKKYGSDPISESFAEAFADVYANGDNASEASKVYTKVLLDELKKYGG